jgi:bacterioferritin (cytochrome b1)
MSNNAATLIAELNTLLRLTNTETTIAQTRRGQAGSEAIERELARNAEESRQRARLIAQAIRDLGGIANVVAVAAGRAGAVVKTQLEQGTDLSQALLGDLALEQQLYARARFVKVLAESEGQRSVVRLAERLERAHAETIQWLEIRLAEIAVGGPSAIRPTPLQAAAGAGRRLAVLPLRATARGLNWSASRVQQLRHSAEEVLDEQLDKLGELREAAQDIYTAGRDASLRRAEQSARAEGARDTAQAVRNTRKSLGALDSNELPIRDYDDLSATAATQAVGQLSDPSDVRAVLAYEEAHRARARVVDALQARLGAIAREALDDSAGNGGSGRKTTSTRAASKARKDKLADLTVDELREKAAKADIEGRSSMKKDDLVGALNKA